MAKASSQELFMLVWIVIITKSWPCHKDSQNSSCRPRRCCLRREASPSWCHLPCNAQTRWRRPQRTACRPRESGSASGAPSRRQNTPHWWRTGPLEGGEERGAGESACAKRRPPHAEWRRNEHLTEQPLLTCSALLNKPAPRELAAQWPWKVLTWFNRCTANQ